MVTMGGAQAVISNNVTAAKISIILLFMAAP